MAAMRRISDIQAFEPASRKRTQFRRSMMSKSAHDYDRRCSISCRRSAVQEIIMQPSKLKAAAPTIRPVVPWNKGAFVGPKPPLKPKQVWSIRLTLQREGRIRDLALFEVAIDSKLRGCDLVQLRIGQLVINAAAWHRATIVQQKTEKPVQFELTQQTRESLIAWLTHRGGGLQDFVFPQPDGYRRSHQHAAV